MNEIAISHTIFNTEPVLHLYCQINLEAIEYLVHLRKS